MEAAMLDREGFFSEAAILDREGFFSEAAILFLLVIESLFLLRKRKIEKSSEKEMRQPGFEPGKFRRR